MLSLVYSPTQYLVLALKGVKNYQFLIDIVPNAHGKWNYVWAVHKRWKYNLSFLDQFHLAILYHLLYLVIHSWYRVINYPCLDFCTEKMKKRTFYWLTSRSPEEVSILSTPMVGHVLDIDNYAHARSCYKNGFLSRTTLMIRSQVCQICITPTQSSVSKNCMLAIIFTCRDQSQRSYVIWYYDFKIKGTSV